MKHAFLRKLSIFWVILFLPFLSAQLLAQNVGIGTTEPNIRAMLDINSTSRGVLIPRMSRAQRNNIASPPRGLLVFVNNDSSFHYYDGSAWVRITPEGSNWLLAGNQDVTGNFLGTRDTSALRLMTNNKERIMIDSAGRIGINTQKPDGGIHMVDDGSKMTDLTIEYNTNDLSIPVVILEKSKGTPNAKLRIDSGMNMGSIYYSGYSQSPSHSGYIIGSTVYARAASDFSFPQEVKADFVVYTANRDNGVDKGSHMIFTHNGRLGVNHLTPQTTVDARTFSPVEGGFFNLSNSDRSQSLVLYSGSQSDPNPFIQWKVGSPLRFVTDAGGISEKMRISSNGNVGIGTTNPGSKLEVAGNLLATTGNFGNTLNRATLNVSDGIYLNGPNDILIEDGQAFTLLHTDGITTTERMRINNAGNVSFAGLVSKGGGSFKIDHPLDPENKYLYHSFVESPDMMNVYNGNITTNEKGEAVVQMPEWFEALNKDFRYQLTVMGQFAQAIVKDELSNNQFSILTDKPNVKVSWQITGIRKDAFAEKHRIPVEQVKPAGEMGTYLHPEAYGMPGKNVIGKAKPGQ